jgi:hypothetical protein
MLGATSSFRSPPPGAGTQVARIRLEGGEQVEIRSGADEAAATALHALLVERVGDERHRDASPPARRRWPAGIEIPVRAKLVTTTCIWVAKDGSRGRTIHAVVRFCRRHSSQPAGQLNLDTRCARYSRALGDGMRAGGVQATREACTKISLLLRQSEIGIGIAIGTRPRGASQTLRENAMAIPITDRRKRSRELTVAELVLAHQDRP